MISEFRTLNGTAGSGSESPVGSSSSDDSGNKYCIISFGCEISRRVELHVGARKATLLPITTQLATCDETLSFTKY